jgi:cysteine synthase
MVTAAGGVRCHIAMPDDAALEKSQLLAALGANVQRVRPVSISHPGHFVNVARKVTPHLPERSHRIYYEEERGLSEDLQQ